MIKYTHAPGVAFDPIEVVEAVYRLDGSEEAWLAGILEAANLDTGHGAHAFTFELREHDEARFPPGFYGRAACYLRTPLGFQTLFEAISRRVPRHVYESLYGGSRDVFSRTSVVAGGKVPEQPRLFRPLMRRLGLFDVLGIVAPAGPGFGAALFGLSSRTVDPSVREQRAWQRTGVHIGAGLRLRRALSSTAAEPDAVLAPDGRVLDARGDARETDAREALREAALRIDRARTRAGRSDSDAALEAWQGLVDGHYSLVEQFESDGRRYLVARRNDPGLVDPRALTPRERAVAYLAAIGRPNKAIAYTLGLAPSLTSTLLKQACRKLGLASAAELRAVRFVDALGLATTAAAAGQTPGA